MQLEWAYQPYAAARTDESGISQPVWELAGQPDVVKTLALLDTPISEIAVTVPNFPGNLFTDTSARLEGKAFYRVRSREQGVAGYR